MTLQDDLAAAAVEELDRAMTLGWRELAKLTPSFLAGTRGPSQHIHLPTSF